MHLHHIFNHKSINFRPFPKFQADPKLRKYLKTFCLLRFCQVCCFKIPLSTRDDIAGIRTLHLDHIFKHKSINFRPFHKFQADLRSRKYLETFCLLRFCQVRCFEIPFSSVHSRREICKTVQYSSTVLFRNELPFRGSTCLLFMNQLHKSDKYK